MDEEFFAKIDYGGKEVDDAISSVDYLKTLPYVDMDRLGHHGLEPRRVHHRRTRCSARRIRSARAPRSYR